MKNFNGKALFLDRSDINTDEIIPAKYLTEISKDALKAHLLEDLVLDGFSQREVIESVNIIITKENFGCGSSREHAPWALEANNINLVVAENFARIFKQNMFNCGMMTIELPKEMIIGLFSKFAKYETTVETDLEKSCLKISSGEIEEIIPFSISDFNRSLIKAGGWVGYADKNY